MAYSTRIRAKIVQHLQLGITSVVGVSQIRKVPRRTLYRWLERYNRFGMGGLENRTSGVASVELSATFRALVVASWQTDPRGVHKLWLDLKSQGFNVSERQIQKVLREMGLTMNKRTRPTQIKFVTYEWPAPNALWHTDWTTCPFTGKQLIAFIDDYSRFIVHAEYFENATTENTLLAFYNAICKHGKPNAILTDQGVQFTPTRAETGPFTQWCEAHGIKHILGRIHHPQTNGKIERWWGTYKLEFRPERDSLDSFVKHYNHQRLHQGIGYQVPFARYKSAINAV